MDTLYLNGDFDSDDETGARHNYEDDDEVAVVVPDEDSDYEDNRRIPTLPPKTPVPLCRSRSGSVAFNLEKPNAYFSNGYNNILGYDDEDYDEELIRLALDQGPEKHSSKITNSKKLDYAYDYQRAVGSGYKSDSEIQKRAKRSSSGKSTSAKSSTTREFHRASNFVRGRYNSSHTQQPTKPPKPKGRFKPPPGLCPPTRYSREARVVRADSGRQRRRRWPEPPKYPPRVKAKDASTECEILKLVEKLDVGSQATVQMSNAASQFKPLVKDGVTQYPRVRKKDIHIQTPSVSTRDMGIQNKPEMKNAMEETSVRILYQPMVILDDKGIQCGDVPTSAHLSIMGRREETKSRATESVGVGRETRSDGLRQSSWVRNISEEGYPSRRPVSGVSQGRQSRCSSAGRQSQGSRSDMETHISRTPSPTRSPSSYSSDFDSEDDATTAIIPIRDSDLED